MKRLFGPYDGDISKEVIASRIENKKWFRTEGFKYVSQYICSEIFSSITFHFGRKMDPGKEILVISSIRRVVKLHSGDDLSSMTTVVEMVSDNTSSTSSTPHGVEEVDQDVSTIKLRHQQVYIMESLFTITITTDIHLSERLEERICNKVRGINEKMIEKGLYVTAETFNRDEYVSEIPRSMIQYKVSGILMETPKYDGGIREVLRNILFLEPDDRHRREIVEDVMIRARTNEKDVADDKIMIPSEGIHILEKFGNIMLTVSKQLCGIKQEYINTILDETQRKWNSMSSRYSSIPNKDLK